MLKKYKEQARARMELLCEALEQLPEGYQPDEAEKALAVRLEPLLAAWLPEPESEADPAVEEPAGDEEAGEAGE